MLKKILTTDRQARNSSSSIFWWLLVLLAVENSDAKEKKLEENGGIQLVEPNRKLNNKKSNLRLETDYDSRPSVRAVHLTCYSCMSSEFEKHWHLLQVLYKQPKNFSDLCLDLPRRSRIGAVQCESACLTIVERKISGGVLVPGKPSGYNVVRGCLSSVFKSNMDSNIKLRSLKRAASSSTRSICNEIDARDLVPQSGVPLSGEERPISRSGGPTYSYSSMGHQLTLCTCYGELCNSQSLGGANSLIKNKPLCLRLEYVFSFLVILLRMIRY